MVARARTGASLLRRLRRLAATGPAPRERTRFVLFLVMTAVVGYQAFALFVKEFGTPRTTGGTPGVVAGEIHGPVEVSQVLYLGAAGFTRVTLEPVAGAARTGQVVFEIGELLADDLERPLYRFARPLEEVLANARFDVTFPAQPDSKGRRYRLTIGMPGAGPGEGFGLATTRDDRHPGTLFVGEREQWGDLVFTTSAEQSTTLAELERLLTGAPAPLRSRWTMAGALLLLNWALAVLLLELAVAPGRSRPGAAMRPRRMSTPEEPARPHRRTD